MGYIKCVSISCLSFLRVVEEHSVVGLEVDEKSVVGFGT